MKDHDRIDAALQTIVDRHSSLGIRCDAYLHHDEIFIDSLERDRDDPATKGRGADLMHDVCALADAEGIRLELTHMRDEPGLGAYYARFGLEHYEVAGGNPDLASMRRVPRTVVPADRSPRKPE